MSRFEEDLNLPPRNLNTFCIPNEPALLNVRQLYRTSPVTRNLESEKQREVFADAFIDNERLGTLAALCVQTIANRAIRHIPGAVLEDPLKLRIYYDSLSVELPLKECYFVEDLPFWQRVVLAKSRDKSLALKKIDQYDWRGAGISLKYVELVEACPAASWRERQMAELGYLVREHMHTLHIRHLESLTDRAFNYHIESDPELDVTSDEPDSLDMSSDESNTPLDEEMEEESEQGQETNDADEAATNNFKGIRKQFRIAKDQSNTTLSKSLHGSTFSNVNNVGFKDDAVNKEFQEERRHQARLARREAMQRLRELHAEQLVEHKRRQQKRNLLRQRPSEPEKKRKPKQINNKKKPKIDGVYDLKVEPEPIDDKDKVIYKRHQLSRIKNYKYPAKHCHHIDLSFVRYFDQLTSLTLEFLGPYKMGNYHQRHLNFSYTDMTRLAKGLRTLRHLEIFRLRNSRMDSIKLIILCRVLRHLDSLQVVDLGGNRLGDDCNIGLGELLKRRVMLRSLELENNDLENITLETLGYTLSQHKQVDSDSSLRYLGLSYNPISNIGLESLFGEIIGTQHVQELSINGLHNVSPGKFVEQVSILLRNHAPLRRLQMAANQLDKKIGRDLLRSLEQNHKVVQFDCRACNLSGEEEYEADIIVRRNEYLEKNPFIGDTTQTEESLLELLLSRRHPIRAKLEKERAKRAECLLYRLPEQSSSTTSLNEPLKEEQLKEEPPEDYDIWQSFGIKSVVSNEVVVKHDSCISTRASWHFNPNNFTLDEVREHMHLMGRVNRHNQRF